MKSSFLTALQAQAPKPVFSSTPKPIVAPIPAQAPQAPIPQADPLVVSVDVVLNKNRLDVHFSAKPEKPIIDLLKQNGFWWNPTDKVWFHRDDAGNRAFLSANFGAEFPPIESPPLQALEPIETPEEAEYRQQCPDIDHPTESPEFAEYKNQVDALLQSTGLTPADLMVYAINYLYRQTIAN